MDRLFTIIARINSVLLLLILLGAGVALAWTAAVESNRWHRRGAMAVTETEADPHHPVMLNFGDLETVTGTNTQMMRLTAREKSTKLSSGGGGSEIRNILFLTGNEKAPRWLFKDQKNLILVASQLRKDSSGAREQPTKALYFEYVADDTNKDGELSSEDRSNVALANPSGTGFWLVLQDVSRVFSHQLVDQTYLSVVYQKGTTVKHSRFSLPSFKLEVDQEIINVPTKL
jgi:hypothetical protein